MDGKIGKIARLFFKLTRRIEREDSLKFREKELRLNSAKGNKASHSPVAVSGFDILAISFFLFHRVHFHLVSFFFAGMGTPW